MHAGAMHTGEANTRDAPRTPCLRTATWMGERSRGFHPLDAAGVLLWQPCSSGIVCRSRAPGRVLCVRVWVQPWTMGERPLALDQMAAAVETFAAGRVTARCCTGCRRTQSDRVSRCVCAAGHHGATRTAPGAHSARAAPPPRASRPPWTRRTRTATSSGCLTADQDMRIGSWTTGGRGAGALRSRCLVVGVVVAGRCGLSRQHMRFWLSRCGCAQPRGTMRLPVGKACFARSSSLRLCGCRG